MQSHALVKLDINCRVMKFKVDITNYARELVYMDVKFNNVEP